MCGIFAIFDHSNKISSHAARVSLETIHHRGPDYTGDALLHSNHLYFGHKRLAILDLSLNAVQPMSCSENLHHIIFNGELYNHKEIRRMIGDRYKFKTSSDTETLIAAYTIYGKKCLDILDGMFAFVIYDVNNKLLFIARDRAGEKPLYYYRSRNGIIISSEVKAIYKYSDNRFTLNKDSLTQYLTYGYCVDEQTLTNDIEKLSAGSFATYDLENNNINKKRYWEIPNYSPIHSEEDIKEELKKLLTLSIKQQLEADVPVGVLLSGGVDSSLVTAIAAKQSKSLMTFNLGFNQNNEFDESSYANLVAKKYGTKHHQIFSDDINFELLHQLAKTLDDPICDTSIVPTFLISRLISENCKVALGGDGADELFGGYHSYTWAQRQALARKLVPSNFRAIISRSANKLPLGTRGRNYLLGLDGNLRDVIANNTIFYDPVSIRKLLRFYRPISSTQISERKDFFRDEQGIPGAMMLMDFETYLREDILVKVDRMSMQNSLEVRSPFLSKDLIEFAYTKIPNKFRVRKGVKKYMLKQIAKDLLPENLNLNRKQGFSIPVDKWLRTTWRKQFEEYMLDTADPYFNKDYIHNLIYLQRNGSNIGERLLAIFFVKVWLEEYKIG